MRMVVMGVTRPAMGPVASTRRGVNGRGFGVKAEAVAQTEATMSTGAVTVTSLLALQESESGLQQDREARQQGAAVVDELSELQIALLGEGEPDLHRLAQLVARPSTAADPALAGLLRAIRLRASIELARHGYTAHV